MESIPMNIFPFLNFWGSNVDLNAYNLSDTWVQDILSPEVHVKQVFIFHGTN